MFNYKLPCTASLSTPWPARSARRWAAVERPSEPSADAQGCGSGREGERGGRRQGRGGRGGRGSCRCVKEQSRKLGSLQPKKTNIK